MRLAAYRDRGLFPQNEGQCQIRAVPIFVDRSDTACAVGHLMRLSGWKQSVAIIQAAKNLVYVPESSNTAVARWIQLSGLTLEEAALIQPGYPIAVNELMSQYGPGGSALIQNGLRYENFELAGSNFTNPPAADPSACRTDPNSCLGTPAIGGNLPDPAEIGLRVGTGTYLNGDTGNYLDPVGTHWIGIGGVFAGFVPGLIGGQAAQGNAQRIILQFDVSAVSPEMRINQLTQHSDPLEGGLSTFLLGPPGPNDPPANYVMVTRALDNLSEIAKTTLDRDTAIVIEPSISGGEQISTMNFDPRPGLTVETSLFLINGVTADSYAIDFNLIQIPEPATLSLCFTLFAGALVSGAGRRCRRL
jgi:hypothetical protein